MSRPRTAVKALVSDTLITRPRSEFINILVGFVVMLSISPIVASFVAMYLLGAKSLVFKSLAEQVSLWPRLTHCSRHWRGVVTVGG